jgi:hypothetical protein
LKFFQVNKNLANTAELELLCKPDDLQSLSILQIRAKSKPKTAKKPICRYVLGLWTNKYMREQLRY